MSKTDPGQKEAGVLQAGSPGALSRMGYGLSQTARVAFYLWHSMAARRVQERFGTIPAHTERKVPNRATFFRSLAKLFADDWNNIAAGTYALPHDLLVPPGSLAQSSTRFFADLPDLAKRRAAGRANELRSRKPGRLPAYYMRNFHYQTDGYLTTESAKLYDFQVETLFAGAADAMRRQALVPIATALAGRDQRGAWLVDLACGTGRFLSFVMDNYPRLNVVGMDLSLPYAARAGQALSDFRPARVLCANAETIPLADESQDIVTAIYLFHELPPAIRRAVAQEIGRVVKPGGVFVFLDSLQFGDVPDFDGLLELFPAGFHEPYFLSYARTDLPALFASAGLTLVSTRSVFLSKLAVFKKVGG